MPYLIIYLILLSFPSKLFWPMDKVLPELWRVPYQCRFGGFVCGRTGCRKADRSSLPVHRDWPLYRSRVMQGGHFTPSGWLLIETNRGHSPFILGRARIFCACAQWQSCACAQKKMRSLCARDFCSITVYWKSIFFQFREMYHHLEKLYN